MKGSSRVGGGSRIDRPRSGRVLNGRGTTQHPLEDVPSGTSPPDKKLDMEDMLQRLREGERISVQEHKRAWETLGTNAGRVAFIRALDRGRSEVCLPETSFGLLASLMDRALVSADCHEDFHAAKVIMHMSNTYYCIQSDGHLEFAQTRLVANPVWRSVRFWEGAFFDAVTYEQKKQQRDDGRKWREKDEEEREQEVEREQNVRFGQLTAFALNMVQMDVPPAFIRQFLERISLKCSLKEEQYTMLMDFIEKECADVPPQRDRLEALREKWRSWVGRKKETFGRAFQSPASLLHRAFGRRGDGSTPPLRCATPPPARDRPVSAERTNSPPPVGAARLSSSNPENPSILAQSAACDDEQLPKSVCPRKAVRLTQVQRMALKFDTAANNVKRAASASAVLSHRVPPRVPPREGRGPLAEVCADGCPDDNLEFFHHDV